MSEAAELRAYLKRLLPREQFDWIQVEANLLVERASAQNEPLFSCAIALAGAELNDRARETRELTRKTEDELRCPECRCFPPGHKIDCKTGNERARRYQSGLAQKFRRRRKR